MRLIVFWLKVRYVGAVFTGLIFIAPVLASTNSSKPPSTDPNRKKQARKKNRNKAGDQNGHVGTPLNKIDTPDRVKEIKVNRRRLPAGQHRQVSFESRQVFDNDVLRFMDVDYVPFTNNLDENDIRMTKVNISYQDAPSTTGFWV